MNSTPSARGAPYAGHDLPPGQSTCKESARDRPSDRRRYLKHVTAVQLTSATLDEVIAWAKGRGAEVPWSGVDASAYIAISVRAPGHDGELHVAADDYLVVDDAGVWSVYAADMFPHAHTDATPA